MRIPYISLLAAGALALGGCAYGDLGMGYGSPYYGAGYGSSYYGSGYGSPYYGSYGSPYGGYGGISIGYGSYSGGYGGYGYGSPFGWYDNYYYPGTGYYVYDSYRRPHAMSTTQRAYWTSRSPALSTSSTTRARAHANWSGFDRKSANRAERKSVRQERQTVREERRQQRRDDGGRY